MLNIRRFDIFILRIGVALSYLIQSGTGASNPVCGVTSLSGSGSGRVRSPNYPRNYPKNTSCVWSVKISVGRGMRLEIEHLENKEFSMGAAGRCYDTLDIYQVSPDGKPRRISQLCASSVAELPSNIIDVNASANGETHVLIKFKSDYAVQLPGFSIYYKALCSASLEGSRGVVMSPGYPADYPIDTKCVTTIRTPPGSKILLTFVDFNIQQTSQCFSDYLSISSVSGGTGVGTTNNGKKYCGLHKPQPLMSRSNHLTLEFSSDSHFVRKGFKAVWTIAGSADTTTTSTSTTSKIPTRSPSQPITSPTTAVTSPVPTTSTMAVTQLASTAGPVVTSTTPMTSVSSAASSKFAKTNPAEARTASVTIPGPAPTPMNMDAFPYAGNCSVTESGYTCQRWDSNSPHKPNFRPAPADHNFCRTPDRDPKPWCYTTTAERWEYCDVSNCPTTTKLPPTTIMLTSSKIDSTAFTTTGDFGNKTEDSVLESKEQKREQGWVPFLLIGIGLIVLIVVLVLAAVILVRRRRKGHGHMAVSHEEVVFRPMLDEPEWLERPRENTYVEIPFISAEELATGTGNYHPHRRTSDGSLDSIAAAKRELFEDKPQQQLEEQPYMMAADTSLPGPSLPPSGQEKDCDMDNPYQQIDYVRTEDVTDLKTASTSKLVLDSPKQSASVDQKKEKKKGLMGFFGKKSKELSPSINNPLAAISSLPPPVAPRKMQPEKQSAAECTEPVRQPAIPPKQRESIVSSKVDPTELENDDDVFGGTPQANHYQCPSSIKEKFASCNGEDVDTANAADTVLESDYASPTNGDVAFLPNTLESPFKRGGNSAEGRGRILPDSSFKVSIDPLVIDRANGSIDNDDGWYAVPTSPTFDLVDQKNSLYDNPTSRPSERSSSGESYCSMNKVPSPEKGIKKKKPTPPVKGVSSMKQKDRESGLYMHMQSQPDAQGIHYQNLTYGKKSV